jgi:hypothetical protein
VKELIGIPSHVSCQTISLRTRSGRGDENASPKMLKSHYVAEFQNYVSSDLVKVTFE